MYSAQIKQIILTSIAVVMLWGCSSESAATADALLSQAESALSSGDYRIALDLTDSIQRAFPTDASARRAANHLHAQAMVGYTQAELAATDSLILDLQAEADSLQRSVTTISVPGSESYIVATADRNYSRLGTFDGLHGRLSPDRQLILVSSTSSPLGHKSIVIKAGGEQIASSAVAPDGELNRREKTGEIVHHTGTMADSIARFIAQHRDLPVTLRFEGGSSAKEINLSGDMVRSIAVLSGYRDIYRRLQLLLLERERLTRQLDVARNQVARTTPD